MQDIGRENKEINFIMFDNIELKLSIKIIKKSGFGRKKSNTIHKKAGEEIYTRGRGYSLPSSSGFSKPEISFKEKIKIFSGEFVKRQIYKAKVIPGKLKIPSLFKKGMIQKIIIMKEMN